MQMLQSKSAPVSWWKNTFAASKNTGYANSRANGRGSLEANTILRDIVNSPIDLLYEAIKEINCSNSTGTNTETHRCDCKQVSVFQEKKC